MRSLKILCFLTGIVALSRPIVYPFLPQDVLQRMEANPYLVMGGSLVIAILGATLCVLLANRLHRSAAGWGIFGFFLTFLACLILPFLKATDPSSPRKSWWNTESPSYGSGSSYGSGGYYSRKTCSACGREVPDSSHAGQHCPYCHAYWGTESKRN